MIKFKQTAMVALLITYSMSANAALIDHGTYFTDTSTGLDWLNNQPLAGQSYNSVLGGFGGYASSGWRFATGTEINMLVSTYVGPLPVLSVDNSWMAINSAHDSYDSAYHLIEVLGINVSFGTPPDPRATNPVNDSGLTSIATQGWYDDESVGANVGIFYIGTRLEPSVAPYVATQIFPDAFSANDYKGSYVSAILIRQSTQVPAEVPVPSAIWLFGSGLGLLLVSRRKK